MSLRDKVLMIGGAAVLVAVVLFVLNLSGPGSAGRLTAGFTAEFIDRPDGYKGLTAAYGFEFAVDPRQMDPGLMYKACAEGEVDVICAFATDGRIAAYDLVPLKDDKQFFPPYYAAPVVRAKTLQKYPKIEALLNRLGGTIDDATMQQLNLEVDRKENPRRAADVARDFLVRAKLIAADAQPGTGAAGTIVVGSKDFTEQNILGELLATLIECNTDIKVERKLFLGGTMICFNALKAGDLDLYAEYTGTGLVNILQQDVINDLDKAYQTVQGAFRQRFDLIWLSPLGFNNTYTITMRRTHAGKLGIKTISDLAAHVGKEK